MGCFTWLQSASNPANDIVDPSHLVVSVDVHTHLPETDRLRTGVIHTGTGNTETETETRGKRIIRSK